MKLLYLTFLLLLTACASKDVQVNIENLYNQQGIHFRAVSALSEGVVWVSGTGSLVLRSTDDGQTWETTKVIDSLNLDFRSLWAFDENTAVVASVASPGYIFKTTDAGKTWKQVYENSDPLIFMNSISFKDSKHGIIIGDQIEGRFFTAYTEDGGDTWTEIEGAEGVEKEGCFAASNTCITYQEDGKISFVTGIGQANYYYANDGDFDWMKSTTKVETINENGADGIYTLWERGDNYVLVGGGNYLNTPKANNVINISEDGGKTWVSVESDTNEGLPHGFVSCIKGFRGSKVVIAIGSHGISLSQDLGKTWKPLEALNGYHSLSVSPDNAMYAVGSHGQIAKITY